MSRSESYVFWYENTFWVSKYQMAQDVCIFSPRSAHDGGCCHGNQNFLRTARNEKYEIGQVTPPAKRPRSPLLTPPSRPGRSVRNPRPLLEPTSTERPTHATTSTRGAIRNPKFRDSEIVRLPIRYSDGQQLIWSDNFEQPQLHISMLVNNLYIHLFIL